MKNLFTDKSNYELNLMAVKYGMRNQPFIKVLPQQNIFGGELGLVSDGRYEDDTVRIKTESGRIQEINFFMDASKRDNLMQMQRINVLWDNVGSGGKCIARAEGRPESVFGIGLDFTRALLCTYLMSVGLLEGE